MRPQDHGSIGIFFFSFSLKSSAPSQLLKNMVVYCMIQKENVGALFTTPITERGTERAHFKWDPDEARAY